MGRDKRVHFPGLIYHVTNRGNNRRVIFLEKEDYQEYLSFLYRFKKKYEFKLFAFCLMTNHVHLLIQVSVKGNISKIMQSLTVAHTRHYHFKYQSCGHAWQGRFKSSIVSDDEYMLRVMQYIEQNPLRAKMVRRVGDYPWTSFRLNIRSQSSRLIDREENPIWQSLGDNDDARRRIYAELMRQNIEEKTLETIRATVKTGASYVSFKFQEQIAQMLPQKRKRGRPRMELKAKSL